MIKMVTTESVLMSSLKKFKAKKLYKTIQMKITMMSSNKEKMNKEMKD
jgi:hypothetical protein